MKIGIFDAITQENIVRDMTDEEVTAYEAYNAEARANEEARVSAEEKAIANKKALLLKLGISADEAKLLLS